MEKTMEDALIGQMAADAALLRALAAVLTSISPQLRQAIEQQVEAAALLEKQTLPGSQRESFDQRLTELRPLWQ